MTDLAALRRLFDHNTWANRKVLEALEAAGEPESEAVGLLVHVLAAEAVWLSRLRQEGQSLSPWPGGDLADCRERLESLAPRWAELLGELSNDRLDVEVPYHTSRGVPQQSTRRDMLLQVLLHGQHHRGQITRALREGGAAPPVIDYIVYARSAPKDAGPAMG